MEQGFKILTTQPKTKRKATEEEHHSVLLLKRQAGTKKSHPGTCVMPGYSQALGVLYQLKEGQCRAAIKTKSLHIKKPKAFQLS